MIPFIRDNLQQYGVLLVLIFGVCLTLAGILLTIAQRQASKINIPDGANLVTTLQNVPFYVVLGIDLLDLALDFLATPITWVFLDQMGLKALRNISAIEAVIPGTQFIPTLSFAWIAVNIFGVRF